MFHFYNYLISICFSRTRTYPLSVLLSKNWMSIFGHMLFRHQSNKCTNPTYILVTDLKGYLLLHLHFRPEAKAGINGMNFSRIENNLGLGCICSTDWKVYTTGKSLTTRIIVIFLSYIGRRSYATYHFIYIYLTLQNGALQNN